MTFDPKRYTEGTVPGPRWYPTTPSYPVPTTGEPLTTFTQKGWECPKCGNVLAPFMPHCSFCAAKKSQVNVTVTTATNETQAMPVVKTCVECGRVPKSSWVDEEGRIGKPGLLYCGPGGCLQRPG